MAWTEQDYQEIVARLKTESQGVGDVPNAETLTGISSLPAYQEKDGEDIIVRAPLELLAAPALDAADKANAAATKAESNATAAQTAANSANEKAGLAAQAASDANAAKEGAETATQSANNAASNAEEKAAAANTAAQDAEKVANNPTYIGKDHYVYVYNKETESFDKTDIYCKGEPGSSFRVAGEYATLEALKSAVPDGSAVDGFMAVGTEAPYDYYAWVNGEWVSQGKIAGGNVINFPSALLNLTSGSESSEILSVFGGLDALRATIAKLRSDNCIIVCGNKNGNYTYVFDDYHVNYTDENNFKLSLFDISGKSSINVDFLYMIVALVDGVAEIASKKKHSLVKDSDVLTKTNTSSFTPTGDYQPATKKYVDDIGYGKSLTIPNVNTILHPTLLQGQDAQSKIDELFGGAESFKGVVEDILIKHTRYYFHFDNNFTNCIELGCVNAWRSNERTSYELHFIVVYNTNNIYYTSRIGVIYNVDVNATKYYVAHLVQSDNLTTLTKKTADEYKALGSKDANTAYCVTD